MNASRVVAWMFGAAVVGAWLASAAGVPRPGSLSRASERVVEPNPVDRLAADVQAQAGRLRQRLDGAPAPQTPVRNPFAFSRRAEPVSRPARVATVVLPPAPSEPAEPSLDLVGLAEKKAGEGVVRTAMISDGSGDVIMATVGQRILGIYDVMAIGHDAIEFKHVVTGQTRRLALR